MDGDNEDDEDDEKRVNVNEAHSLSRKHLPTQETSDATSFSNNRSFRKIVFFGGDLLAANI